MLAPGKIGLNNKNYHLSARYTDTDRGIYGPSTSYLYPYITPLNMRNTNYERCKHSGCKTCPFADNTQISNTSKKLSPHYKQIFCKAFNIIYKLTCNICQMAYVGQTSNALHYRMNQHRKNVKDYVNTNEPHKYNAEFDHFKLHGFNNITIAILDIKKTLNERLFIENQYIKHDNTNYPYGLNQIVNNKHTANHFNHIDPSNYNDIYSTLNFQNFKKTTRHQRGSRTNKRKCIPSNNEIKKHIHALQKQFYKNYNWLKIRGYVFSIRKKHLKNVYNIAESLKLKPQFTHILMDLILFRAKKLNTIIQTKTNNQKPNSQCIITFTSKLFNDINFNKLFKNNEQSFPIKNCYISKTFKYPKTTGRRIFNYNTFAKQFNHKDKHMCKCNEPKFKQFINTKYGHIVTGDLSIVTDSNLKYIMSQGTKFRIPVAYNHDTLTKLFSYDIDYFIYKHSISHNTPTEAYNEWKQKVIVQFKKSLQKSKIIIKDKKYYNLNKSIHQLQNQYVITYIDKSQNNYAIICKKLYHTLLNNTISNNSNFTPIDTNITINNKKILAFHRLLKISNNNLNYPYIVLIPKFHKTPIKFREVTIGCNTYNNETCKKLLNILKIIHENEINNNTKSVSIKNSFELTKRTKHLQSVRQIITYDFQDLFNNINLTKLKQVIDELFHKNQTSLTKISPEYFNDLTNFLIFNNYLYQNNIIYKQTQGIPQGSSVSSMLADLYLYHSEMNYINKNPLVFRYIDDVISIYLNETNDDTIPIKYPSELTLIKNVNLNNTTNYLDLNITIQNNALNFNLYDKRIIFPFNVNLFTPFNSCLHKSIYRNILLNYLHRIKKLCSKQYIKQNVKSLKSNASKYHYPSNFLDSIIKNHSVY